ncbi:MAG TPA: GAF domain-containing protein [Chromatiaceae bacterium]|nr:GAF domain-containing protein [Chromatiaceae bacterium]
MQVYQDGQPIIINFTEESFIRAKKEMGKKLLDAGKIPTNMVFIPLRAGAEIIGVISAQNYQFYWYTDSDVALLSGIANHTAVALQNIRLLTEAQTRAEQERTLRDITARVSTAVDAQTVLRVAAEEIGRVLNLETYVYLTDPDAPENGAPQNGS